MNCTSSKREGVRLHSTPVAEALIALVHARKPIHHRPNAKAFGYIPCTSSKREGVRLHSTPRSRPVRRSLGEGGSASASVHLCKPLHHD